MDLTDGRRFALFIDEAWDWIRNEVVAKEVHNKEKQYASKMALLCLAHNLLKILPKVILPLLF